MKTVRLSTLAELISDEVIRTESRFDGAYNPEPTLAERLAVSERLAASAKLISGQNAVYFGGGDVGDAAGETLPAWNYLALVCDFENGGEDFSWYLFGFDTQSELAASPHAVMGVVYVRDYNVYRRCGVRFTVWQGGKPVRVSGLAYEFEEAGRRRAGRREISVPGVCEITDGEDTVTVIAGSICDVFDFLAFSRLPDICRPGERAVESGEIFYGGARYEYMLSCDGGGGRVDYLRDGSGRQFDPEKFDFC